jgi:hypothetical protein
MARLKPCPFEYFVVSARLKPCPFEYFVVFRHG